MGEEPAPSAGHVRDRSRQPCPADPGRAVHAPLGGLRTREGSGRPARLRRHAHPDGRAARGRPADGRDGPGALRLVQRRRVPGHEPAPAAPPGALAGRPRRPVRGRRRGPDDLHVRRRDVDVPDGLRGPLPGSSRGDPGPQLPEQPGGPCPRKPPPRRGGAPQEARGDAAVRAGAHDPALRRRGCRARSARGLDPPSHRERDATRRGRGPGADQRPDPAPRGGPHEGWDRVPCPRAALLRAARSARGAPAPAAVAGRTAGPGARRRTLEARVRDGPGLRPRRRVRGRRGAGADGRAGARAGDRR